MKMEPFEFPTDEELAQASAEPEQDQIEVEEVDDPAVAEDQLEVEVEDDTPVEDRDRTPVEPPEEISEEDLAKYKKKSVRDRVAHFTRAYHDERRAKELALRERQAAEDIARAARAELERMRSQMQAYQSQAQSATRTQLEAQYAAAKKSYREAYEAGDTDALEQANEAMIDLKYKLATTPAVEAPEQPQAPQKPAQEAPQQQSYLQQPQNVVQNQQTAPQPDEKALSWHAENPWFGQDQLMTQFASGLHEQLIQTGVDPTSDDYYTKLNARVRQAFPDYGWDDSDQETPRQATQSRAKRTVNVAPATRSTSPRKVSLKQSEIGVARRLGVSLEEYARQKAELNGGR